MTAPDSPCYLCSNRSFGCHSRCKDYIAYAQYRQAANQAKQDGGLTAYAREMHNKLSRRTN